LNNNCVFALFYLSIISVCLLGSLYSNHLNSNGNAVPDDNLNGQAIFSADAEADKQVISVFASANYTWMNFTFTWGSDTQKIVQGEFHLKVSMKLELGRGVLPYNESLMIVIEANDDDYDGWDYVGLAFDTNHNGYIDTGDISRVLFANNMTQPSFLKENGFLAFAECMPKLGPQNVSFNPDTGYIFTSRLPTWEHPWNPAHSLNKGCNNPLHICFHDNNLGNVFIRFIFYIPEE